MKYNAQKLAKALFKLIQENSGREQEITENFMSFCKKKHLIYLLPNFFRYFKAEAKREGDVKTFKIFSAIELPDSIIKSIQKISGTKDSVAAQVIQDKDIIAGFIAYYQNKIIDASLSNNLRILKNKLINA